MRRFRDVHFYDGKMEDNVKTEHTYSEEEKKELFTKLKERLTQSDAKNMVDLISQGGNHDTVNNMLACNILAEISKNIDNELVPILEEQLIDTYHLGRCPQGRVWRLLQIYRALPVKNEKKEEVLEEKKQDDNSMCQ